jgi:hypothetical protein
MSTAEVSREAYSATIADSNSAEGVNS